MSLHNKCANGDDTTVPLAALVKKGNKWYCEECKSCDACSTQNEKGPCVLSCNYCLKNFHFSCMDPAIVDSKKLKSVWRYEGKIGCFSIALLTSALTNVVLTGVLLAWLCTVRILNRKWKAHLSQKSDMKQTEKKRRRRGNFAQPITIYFSSVFTCYKISKLV